MCGWLVPKSGSGATALQGVRLRRRPLQRQIALRPNFLEEEELSVPRLAPAKLAGLLFGGLVVAVMLFMMFVILGNLFMGEQ